MSVSVTKTPAIRRTVSSGTERFAKGVVIDHHTGMPLIKSLVEGGFYMPREPRLKKSGKIDYIAHNRKMTREYRSRP